MIELIYSNKTERLLKELAKDLSKRREQGAHPLAPVEIVVPNRNMETWLRLGLAQSLGVAANLRFRFLNRLIGDLVSDACPGEMKLADLDTVEAAVLAALMDEALLEMAELQPVRSYLQSSGLKTCSGAIGFDARLAADGADLRRVQLAARVAFLFQEYSFSRPEMVAAWRSDGCVAPAEGLFALPQVDQVGIDPSAASMAAWQRALWRAVFGAGGILEQNPPAEGDRWVTMDLLAQDDNFFKRIKSKGLPPVHIFGISYMARLFQHLLARLGEAGRLKVYCLNPCAEFWEDVETDREFFYRLDQEISRRERRIWNGAGESGEEDPFGLFAADTPALRYWGRPGREHVRLLGELTDCDFTGVFEDPCARGGGLLHRLQRDILLREPERVAVQAGAEPGFGEVDQTIRLVAAPSVRREVEWVADEIWRLMREDKGPDGLPLRFSDVAIIVNSAGQDIYLPQIEAVFDASHSLPCSFSDLPGASCSRLIEATELLFKLPFGRFSRSEMLTLMGHPAVLGDCAELTPGDLAAMAERLGIVFGADRQDHAGTYIDEDVYNWDQGVIRLALGAFMTGEKSGDRRIFEAGAGRWLVEEVSGRAASTAARFGLLVRMLLTDAKFVREQRLTLSEWVNFYAAQIERYFCAKDRDGERDRLRLLRALGRLEAMDLGHKVSGRMAAEIALRAVNSLEGGQGRYLAEGVVVSSFLPMRAIPFKVVFLLGLGEGLFPASNRRDALDLRAVRRRAGDVDPSERDRYMFLETLLCTRERLYLSYVGRDENTGDPLQPSAVVQELLHMLKVGYLGETGVKSLNLDPPLPLRRYDEDFDRRDTFFDEARVEARVQEIARGWRAQVNWEIGEIPFDTPAQIIDAVSPENRAWLSEMLLFPGAPPAGGFVSATPRPATNGEGAARLPITLTLSALRRFLECPMQGWASALLGLAEVEEDLADREEEDFEISRLVEARLLNDLYFEAAATGVDPETLYRERSSRLRLAGQFPAGALGKAIERRHLGIITGWISLLGGLHGTKGACEAAANPFPLRRVRLGRSGRHNLAETASDPLLLEAPFCGPENTGLLGPVRLSGLTEGFSEDLPASVILLARKPPRGKDTATLAGAFRYILRGVVSQAAQAALGASGSGDRQILLMYADGANAGGLKVTLRPLASERARAWLTEVAADLLMLPHAYLLPCEAVMQEYCSRSPDLANPLREIDGEKLCALVKEMANNERSRFSSLWGPVPSPRLYAPPPAQEAVRIVRRRFEPLFGDITGLEVI
jgi:exodeoxyribonuclease V gamma subunit